MWIQACSTLCLGCPAHMELYCADFCMMLLLLQGMWQLSMCSNVCILQDSFYVTATKSPLVPRIHLSGSDGFLTYIKCYNSSLNMQPPSS